MCTYIYTLHKDCLHKQYQNTFKCLAARGSVLHQSSRSLTLDHTIYLPDQPPKEIPDAMCDGKIKQATRPVSGRCRACIRKEKEMKQKLGQREDMDTATGVRNSVLGLQQLVAATKPLDLEE